MDFIGHELLVCCYHQGHRIFQSWIDEKSNRLYLLLCWWEHANRCKMGPNIFLSSLKSHSKKNLFWTFFLDIPYTRHHKPLLIRRRSWIQVIHKDRIFWKNLLQNKDMVFGDGVKNKQAAAYNGACTEVIICWRFMFLTKIKRCIGIFSVYFDPLTKI